MCFASVNMIFQRSLIKRRLGLPIVFALVRILDLFLIILFYILRDREQIFILRFTIFFNSNSLFQHNFFYMFFFINLHNFFIQRWGENECPVIKHSLDLPISWMKMGERKLRVRLKIRQDVMLGSRFLYIKRKFLLKVEFL